MSEENGHSSEVDLTIVPAAPSDHHPAQPTPQELLDAVHSFPCDFHIKVIGASDNDFIGRVVAAVINAEVAETDIKYTSRETAGGRHTSVSIDVIAQSSAHVMAIYAAIRTVDGVVMVM
jgi:putative lipoic acid-binding regulatory protein